MAKKLLKVLYKTIVIVKKCHFGTMVGWVKGFDPLFETYYLSVIAYGRSQINISENPLPILQKNHFLTITRPSEPDGRTKTAKVTSNDLLELLSMLKKYE